MWRIKCGDYYCLIFLLFSEIPYEVTVFTGDVQNGGTDAAITMCVFGSSGYTSDIVLEKNGERFERGREDLMKVCIGKSRTDW